MEQARTDLERTVIDGINNFEKIGGLEELLLCIGMIPYLDMVLEDRAGRIAAVEVKFGASIAPHDIRGPIRFVTC